MPSSSPAVSDTANAIDRRTFVGTSVAGAVAASVGLPRVAFAHDATTATRSPHATHAPTADLEELTIAELQAGMQSGTYTARSLVEQYRARIDALDQRGPALNHVLELNPDALAIADALDAERRAGRTRGP